MEIKFNILESGCSSLYNVAYMLVFRVYNILLDKQLVCFTFSVISHLEFHSCLCLFESDSL